MSNRPALYRSWNFLLVVAIFLPLFAADTVRGAETAADMLKKVAVNRGIIALLDLPSSGVQSVVDMANASELTIYFQSAEAAQVSAVRQAADAAGFLGRRIVAQQGAADALHLADNVADGIVVSATASRQASEAELPPVLRPQSAIDRSTGTRLAANTVPG